MRQKKNHSQTTVMLMLTISNASAPITQKYLKWKLISRLVWIIYMVLCLCIATMIAQPLYAQHLNGWND